VLAQRYLIVNADDFGQSAAVNRGILRAHREGIVTSTSLMVRWPHAREAAAAARELPGLAVGLHLDLGEWRYDAGEWRAVYEVVSFDDPPALEREIRAQLRRFHSLVGQAPTHLDSHQHVHRRPVVREIVEAAVAPLAVPLRHYSEAHYCGRFYGQDTDGTTLPDSISADALIRILEALPEGVTELACHPADGEDLQTMYRGERMRELQALCEARVREAVARLGIILTTYASMPRGRA